jgi:hypothetical protein
MILQATTRCVLHQQGWQAFAFDLYRAVCVSYGKRSSFFLMSMQNLQPGVLKLPNFQVLIATSCSDCKIARIISKPQPWRRTESSDRNALLQVVWRCLPLLLIAALQFNIRHHIPVAARSAAVPRRILLVVVV